MSTKSDFSETWDHILHVYAQDQWHDEAFLVGDRAALEKVRAAIDAALESGFGKAVASAADGEGYHLHVVRHDAERMKRLRLPYASFDHPDIKGRYPSSLVPREEGEEVPGDDEWFAFQRAHGLEFEEPGPVDAIQAAEKPERP